MKILKQVTAIVLILCLTLAMGATAFAADNATAGSITIKGTTDGKTYDLYRIFDLTYTGTGATATAAYTIADDWKAFFKSDAGKAYIADTNTTGNLPQIVVAGDDGAKTVKYINITAANIKAFSKDALAYAAEKTPDKTAAGNGNDVTVSNIPLGYYLVYPEGATEELNGSGSICSITSTVPTEEVTIKAGYPDIDKKIKDKGTTSTASIGDSIPYEVTGKVPDMTGYKNYKYVITDTMSKGLTFNDDVTITVGGTTLTKDNDFTVSKDANEDNTEITITFKNFIQYKDQAGAEIKVSYSATLNEKAAIGTEANTNKAKLTYSNDPKNTGTGDTIGTGDAKGETPEKDTKTYTTQLTLNKVDGANGNALAGAKFKIEGTALSVTLINEVVFRQSEAGTYYMLKDGTYTETVPTEENKTSYDSTTVKYEKVNLVTKDTKETPVTAEGYVNAEGNLVFKGLAAGTYTITELVAPDGYNLLTSPITVTISHDGTQWSAEGATAGDNGVFTLRVENSTGTLLPGTGGIGTTVFYIIGGLMMLAAVVVFVTRRKISSEK